MAKAKKLPSGSWRVRVYDYTSLDGNKHYKSFTGSTKAEAELLATQYLMSEKETKKDITLQGCIEEYLELRQNILSPSTTPDYKNRFKYLKKHYPTVMCKKISKITKKDLQSIINDLAIGRKPKTVYNYYAVISAPLKEYEIELKVKMPKSQKPKYHIPTAEDVQKLLEAVKGKELEVPILLTLSALCRRGEVCAITIDDIQGNVLHINKSMVKNENKEWVIKPPKTASSDRYVQIPDFLVEMIKEKGYVTNMKPTTLYNHFSRTLKKNNIPHFRYHDLRHYGTSLFHQVMPDAYLQKIGGWSNPQTLQNVYRHALSDDEINYTNKANALIEDMFSKSSEK